MNITEVRIRLLKKDEGKLKAIATIILDDCFAIHDIKVIEGDDADFISMPSKKLPHGEFKDIAHPLNNETRSLICDRILQEYKLAVEGVASTMEANKSKASENKLE